MRTVSNIADIHTEVRQTLKEPLNESLFTLAKENSQSNIAFEFFTSTQHWQQLERRVLDLESEVPGSILTRGNILLLKFFVFT